MTQYPGTLDIREHLHADLVNLIIEHDIPVETLTQFDPTSMNLSNGYRLSIQDSKKS